MDALPQLTEDKIQELAFGTSFSRGYDYYERGSILDPRRVDATLRAQCWGSFPRPYYVCATLGAGGIQSADCSCPVSWDGACKHVVALLLTWLHQPQKFQAFTSVEESLNQRSKEELVELILKLVERDPDLEPLLEIPLPGRAVENQPQNPDLIRRQVHAVIDHVPYKWSASYAAAGQVGEIVGNGDAYARAGDWRNAVVVYRTVVEEILDSFEEIYQEENEYIDEVISCVRGLAECLQHFDDAAERSAIVRALFEIARWDFSYGGVGLSDDAELVLIEQTMPNERSEVAAWTRELMVDFKAGEGSTYKNYRMQELGGLLLALEADTLDDEGFIALCRETGRVRDMMGRLLGLGRVQKVVEEARRASDYDLITLSQDIRDAGHAELAEQLLWERQKTTTDARLLQQLLTWVQVGEDTETSLALAGQIFQIRSDLDHYRQLREAAQVAQRWSQVEQEVLGCLAAENKNRLLIEVHLEEGRIDEALSVLNTIDQANRSRMYPAPVGSLHLTVARAAEAARPEAAIEICLTVAQRLIDARGRDNYAKAVQHLVRVRAVIQGMGEDERWQTLIASTRETNRRLPALQDELTRAGL